MSCEDLRPDYLLYAVGTLADPELSDLREHLRRDCPNCLAGVREAQQYAFAMGAGAEGPAPPRQLRARILNAAGAGGGKRFGWFGLGVCAAGVALAAGIGASVYVSRYAAGQNALYGADVARLRGRAEESRAEAAALRDALALIQSPDTREVRFGENKPAPPRGRVFVHPSSGVLLIASRLAPPPPGRTWEMWIIRGGKPEPAGLFDSDAGGNALHLFRPSRPAQAADVIAVTLEAAGGAPAPTTTPVIVAPI